jgi:asparagine synthase (glutamine-hydrolysing)
LPYDILTKVDIASMMNGLEVRVPFVDRRVVEFAATIPERHSLAVMPGVGWERKLLLKAVAEKYFPGAFVHRPKMGFAMPLQKWFAPGGELHGPVCERLLSPSAPVARLFERAALEEVTSSRAFRRIWLLLVLDEWLRQNT